MITSELIARVRREYPGLRRRDAEVAVNAVIGALVEALVAGRRVEVRGLGSFVVKAARPRRWRNPRTGELVLGVERCAARFRASELIRVELAAGGAPSGDGIEHRDAVP